MKKEKVWFIVLVLTVLGFLFLIMWVGSKGGFILGEKETEQVEKKAEPLNITIPTPTTDGTLTVYDENGEVYFQYSGEINILNSGRNGEPVEVEVMIPVTRCSCFDEEGRLKE